MSVAAHGPWGPGPVSKLPWHSGVAWRGLASLQDFVAGPRNGRGVDLVQLFSPNQQGLSATWDALAGGPGDDPGVHEGALTFAKGGKQGWWIWSNPVIRALPVAYALRIVPDEASNADGKHDGVWRRLGARMAWLDRQFGRTQPLILELGWEQTGSWYAWSIAGGAAGKEAWRLFAAAWERIVTALRAGYRTQSGAHCHYPFCLRGARQTLGGVRLSDILPCPGTWDLIGVTAHDNKPQTTAAAPRASWLPSFDKDGKVAMEGWSLLAELARRYRRGVAILEWAGYPPDTETAYPGNAQGEQFVESFWTWCQEHRDVLAAECFFDRETTSFTSRPAWPASQAYRARWGLPAAAK